MSISDRHRDAIDGAMQAIRSTSPNRESSTTAHAAVVSMVEEVDRDLQRCRRWLDRGLVAESVAYAADCHELLRRAVELQALCEGAEWRSWCERERLPLPPQLDGPALSRLNAAFSRLDAMLEPLREMRRSVLSNEDPVRRIDAVRRLARIDPSNRMWREHVAGLEADAVAMLVERSERALESGDLEEIEASLDRLAAPWRETVPRGLTGRLAEVRDRLRRERSDRAFEALADRAHDAMAAMDDETLEDLESRWKRLVEEGNEPPEHALASIRPPFDHLDAVRRAESADTERRRALDDLERGLDEGRSADEIERLAGGALRFDALPAGLAGRVAAVREREVGRRRRRLAATLAAVAVVGVAVVLAGGRLWSVLDRNAAARASLGELRRLLAENRSVEAASLAREISIDRPDLVDGDPSLAAAIGEAIAASEAELARRERVEAAIAASEAELAREGMTAGEIGDALDRLRQRTAEAAPRERTRLDALQDRWESRRRSRLEQDVLAARRLHTSILEATTSVPEADRRMASDERRRAVDALVAIERDVEQALREFAHLESERERFTEVSLRVQRRLERWRGVLDEQSRYEAALAAIEDPSLDEVAFHEAYRKLVAEHGAMLQADGLLEAHERGERSARASLAIAHWRDVVWPAAVVLSEPGDDGAPRSFEAASRLADQLDAHLAAHPISPYESVAVQVRDRSRHLAGLDDDADTPAEWVRHRFETSGLADLWVIPLRDGAVRYGRGFQDGRIRGAVPSLVELERPLESLAAPLISDADVVGPPEPAESTASVIATLDRIDATTPSRIEAELLNLFSEVAAERFSDPGLQLHLLRLVADVVASLDPAGEAGIEMRRWLQQVRSDHPRAMRQDWLVAAQGASTRNRRDAGRAALAAIAAVPDSSSLARRSLVSADAIRQGMGALSPAGVLSAPTAAGRRALSGRVASLPSFEVVVFDRGSDRCRTLAGELAGEAVVLPNPPPPPAPVQVFTR